MTVSFIEQGKGDVGKTRMQQINRMCSCGVDFRTTHAGVVRTKEHARFGARPT